MTRHVVITGAGSGIGAAIARALAGAGYALTLMGRRREPLQELARELGVHVIAIPCDVTDRDAVDSAMQAARERQGHISILVNCAGAAPTAPFHKLTPEQWQQTLDVNLNGVFHCTQAVLPDQRNLGWGRIINIASTASLKGYAYVSAYCAAKHAVLGLTRSLALELATQGITVNAVCPGYTDTDIIRNAVSDIAEKTGRTEKQALAHFTQVNPQGRLILPEEVAASVLWLVSDGAASVNGQAIAINGGEI